MSRYDPSLDDLVAEVDSELRRFLIAKGEQIGEARAMIEEMSRLAEAGGKRLRPLFCYWGYRAGGGSHGDAIVAASSSLELLHTFAIVHDDIMDRSDERRGMPTSYALHGTDVALLVGDLALVLADAALMESGFDEVTLMRAFGSYSRMRQQVIAGQYMDVVAARRIDMTVEQARRIAVLKSGRYSIQEPLLIGASLAHARKDLMAGLSDFGAPLGEAFQLRDDLLGTFGDPGTVGKPVDSDIREGKRHILYALTLEALAGEERDRFVSLWGGGASLSRGEVEELRSTLVSSGARAGTEKLVDELKAQAHEVLARLEIDPQARAAMTELAARATDRSL